MVRPLESDHQLYPVALTGRQHLIGLAQVHSHGFLAENRLGPPGCCGNNHFRVLLVPGADIHEIWPLFVKHFAIVSVPMLLPDLEEVAKFTESIWIRVSDGANLGWLAGDAEPAAGMHAPDNTTSNNSSTVLTHRITPQK